MFLGVEYMVDGDTMKVWLGTRSQAVPVAMRSGARMMVMVGQRSEYVDKSPGLFLSWPEGDTVTLDTLANPTGLWQQWRKSTRPVKINVARFVYTDALGYPKRHDLQPGEFLQGALVEKKLFEQVYFVIVPQPGTKPEEDRWWPRIVSTQAAGS